VEQQKQYTLLDLWQWWTIWSSNWIFIVIHRLHQLCPTEMAFWAKNYVTIL